MGVIEWRWVTRCGLWISCSFSWAFTKGFGVGVGGSGLEDAYSVRNLRLKVSTILLVSSVIRLRCRRVSFYVKLGVI